MYGRGRKVAEIFGACVSDYVACKGQPTVSKQEESCVEMRRDMQHPGRRGMLGVLPTVRCSNKGESVETSTNDKQEKQETWLQKKGTVSRPSSDPAETNEMQHEERGDL